MKKIRCFDVFNMVAEGLSDDFKKNYEVNETKLTQLEKECEALDSISEDSDCIGFEVDIDEETRDIIISLEFVYVIIVDNLHPEFYDVVQENTKSMKVEKTDTEDVLKLTFVFEGVWD